MTEPREETLALAIRRLQEAGYTEDFRAEADGLCATSIDKMYAAASLEVDEIVRFEGLTNPSDESILFALRSPDGTRGTYAVAYGPTIDPADAEIVQQLDARDRHES